ncbi:hypothetical protein NQZ68_012819 [Dissostichus eleginoides]|nr:hypothetical protein NQZ68_012819 [Dissostichus eleginoides]
MYLAESALPSLHIPTGTTLTKLSTKAGSNYCSCAERRQRSYAAVVAQPAATLPPPATSELGDIGMMLHTHPPPATSELGDIRMMLHTHPPPATSELGDIRMMLHTLPPPATSGLGDIRMTLPPPSPCYLWETSG